jgi:3'(2'), 5'-bisphosphate nucleotidase
MSSVMAVSIALVEDGMPILGVVYDLSNAKLYCGQAGKGSFLVAEDGTTHRLGRAAGETSRLDRLTAPDDRAAADAPTQINGGTTLSDPPPCLAICRVLEVPSRRYHCAAGTNEWETAAADAIARGGGLAVRTPETGAEMRYNKGQLTNPKFEVW